MIYFVAAHGENYELGYKGGLPWPYRSMQHDLERFYELAKSKKIVTGEKTYHNYKDIRETFQTKHVLVVSDSKDELPDAEIVHSIDEIIERGKTEELWVIGGGSVFTQLLPYADVMYLTKIHASFAADVFFPQYSLEDWNVVENTHFSSDERNLYPYTFLELRKK